MILRISRALATLGLVFLLAACGGAAATATPPPTNTPVPPTATTVPPTATTAPPTATTAPPTATTAPPTATTAPPTATTAAPTATRPAASAAASARPSAAASAAGAASARPSAAASAATSARPSAASSAASSARPSTVASSARPSTAAGAGKVMVDTTKACQVTLAGTFVEDSGGGGNATTTDDNAFLNLSAFPSQPLGFEQTATLFIEGFTQAIDDYKEADRQQGTDRGRPYLGVTFTATLIGEPIVGQFYFVEEAGNTCALSVLVKQSAASNYGSIIGSLVDSVQAVKP